MSPQQILEQLSQKGITSEQETTQLVDFEQHNLFSVHWELRTILYFGVTMLSSGLGILIYKNIDSIGHGVLIALIGLLSAACFYYAWKHRKPFSPQLVESDSPFADYALLLACLTFLTMEGYWQYQYNIFGERYGLVTFIPAVLFLCCAYYFDHRGVLSMGLTAFASWVGLTVTPLGVFQNNFSDTYIVMTAVLVGSIFVLVGWLSERYDFKKHFSFTYILLGGNLALIASLVGLIGNEMLLYFVPLALLCVTMVWYARRTQSFFFLLMGVVYGYIGITYLLIRMLDGIDQIFWLGQFYFAFTAVMVIYFFLSYKKILGTTK